MQFFIICSECQVLSHTGCHTEVDTPFTTNFHTGLSTDFVIDICTEKVVMSCNLSIIFFKVINCILPHNISRRMNSRDLDGTSHKIPHHMAYRIPYNNNCRILRRTPYKISCSVAYIIIHFYLRLSLTAFSISSSTAIRNGKSRQERDCQR